MIIYVIGYGRSGTTAVSRTLERKLNAINLGEIKYIYRSEKDDLLDPYWTNFKQKEKKVLTDELQSFDNIFGFTKWRKRERYKELWQKIFHKMNVNPNSDIIIDSSKTQMGSFMRGIYLYHSFKKVYFILPKRSAFSVIRSMLKGKNSNLERGVQLNLFSHLMHVFVIGIPHLILTKLLTKIYKLYGVYPVDLRYLEDEIDYFIEKEEISSMPYRINDLPMVYGNRMRLNIKK